MLGNYAKFLDCLSYFYSHSIMCYSEFKFNESTTVRGLDWPLPAILLQSNDVYATRKEEIGDRGRRDRGNWLHDSQISGMNTYCIAFCSDR